MCAQKKNFRILSKPTSSGNLQIASLLYDKLLEIPEREPSPITALPFLLGGFQQQKLNLAGQSDARDSGEMRCQ
jgi:hypothetical protein